MNLLEGIKEEVVAALKPVLKPLALAIVNKVVFPILEVKAKETKTPIDDMVLASVKVSVVEAIEKAEF